MEKQKMNILLIHPKMTHGPVIFKDRGTIWARFFSNPEMTLPAVAATIPKKYQVEIIHENFEDIDYSNHFDLVGITCFTLFAPQVYEIADKFRNMGVPVVLGGYHPSALPKEAKQHADSVVIGEAEYNFPRLLDDLEKNRLKPFYHINKHKFNIPFVCGCRNLGEAVRRIWEGAAMIRTKGEAATGNIIEAIRHQRMVTSMIRILKNMDNIRS